MLTRILLLTILLSSLLTSAANSYAQTAKRKVCIYDVAGRHGEIYNHMREFQITALTWGVDLELKVYTDEKIAAEDFKAEQCDAVTLTGLRSRAFNNFTGSISAFGAIPSYEHLKLVMQAVSNPKLAPRMINGRYEISGVIPIGAAYLFVNDRNVDTPAEISGKRIAVMDYDKSQASIATYLGASPVSVDVTTFAGKFNNGSVDICGAPAEAYGVLELYKGLEPNGGIISSPILQVTLQMVTYNDKFPADFGQKSREFFYAFYEQRLNQITKITNTIDAKWWVDIPKDKLVEYNEIARQGRVRLRNDGIYDAAMLTLLKRVRCKLDATLSECADNLEG